MIATRGIVLPIAALRQGSNSMEVTVARDTEGRVGTVLSKARARLDRITDPADGTDSQTEGSRLALTGMSVTAGTFL
jgi:hypothetical protein